jgi:uncharacterized protein
MRSPPTLYVDADACPVKAEIYKVAARLKCPVIVVANAFQRVPPDVTLRVVEAGADAADDWIAAEIAPLDIVITNDIPLADRCLKAGAFALNATGAPFTAASIGQALAGRAVMEHLRSFGEGGGGPKPFSAADRQRFLTALDALIIRARRR